METGRNGKYAHVSPFGAGDRLVGHAVGAAVRRHHRRRLRRIGWLGALEAPPGGWAGGDPPPRPGCSLEVLIDGAEALPRMAAELAAGDVARLTSPAGSSRPTSR